MLYPADYTPGGHESGLGKEVPARLRGASQGSDSAEDAPCYRAWAGMHEAEAIQKGWPCSLRHVVYMIPVLGSPTPP